MLILPLIAGAFTFAQSRMMMPPSRPDMSDQERSMQGVTKQMSFIFPVMIFVFSFLFPQGLAIYWATGTIFMVAQQYHLLGWNGLVVPSWFPGANRVTALTIPRTPVKTGAGSGKAPPRRSSSPGKSGSRNGNRPGERQRHQAKGRRRRGGATGPLTERDGAHAGTTQQTEQTEAAPLSAALREKW